MTSTLRLRTLVAGVTLALAGAAVAQAPATPPASAAPATPPAAVAPQATPPASATTPAAPAKTAPSSQDRALRRAQRDAASGATQGARPPSGAATTPGASATTPGASTAAAGASTAAAAAAQPSPGATKNEARAAARAARRERGDKVDAPIGRQLQNAYADLMTPEEMAAHRSKVKQTKTYADCKALFEATGKQMEARAKAQNKEIKASPTEICDKAKERGRLTG